MQKKIQKLIGAAYNYYRLNNSVMPDSDYDELFEEVRAWELNKGIEDKITEKICLGYFEGDSTVKVRHKYPMISIEKNNGRGIEKETVITPKLDGVALELEYIKGQLYRKITRGDGVYGSDVTKYKISGVPNKLGIALDLVVRGEVMCPNYLDYGKVHRNVVAGALGKVDFTEDRGLQFIAYWTSNALEGLSKNYIEELELLKSLGFAVVPYVVCSKPIIIKPDLINHSFPTDGYVLRANDNRHASEKTSHHFKNQWAYKFAAETKETTIINVEWNASKNGYFTPVAILEPVNIDGTTVSRVTLNNLDYIRDRDICINDVVLIHKAKDIIPEIKEIKIRPENRKNIILLECPKCGGTLEMQGVRLTCTNLECSIDLYTEHFAKTIGIKGLAIKSIEKLSLLHPLDLYTLTPEFFISRLGKNGGKIYEQIQNSKNVDVITLLCALNIPAVKKTKLTKIFTKYPDINILADFEKLKSVDGMGSKTSTIVCEWYDEFDATIKPILSNIGFNMKVDLDPVNEAKIIAVTGTLPMSRSEFTKIMKLKGITVKSLTKSTSCLVVGDKPGEGNLTKAQKYGISIIPYHNFIRDISS